MRTDLSATRSLWRHRSLPSVLLAVIVAVGTLLPGGVTGGMRATAHAAGPCDPGGNAVVCENSKPGTPMSDWFAGSSWGDIAGFPTKTSLQAGETLQFKVQSPAA